MKTNKPSGLMFFLCWLLLIFGCSGSHPEKKKEIPGMVYIQEGKFFMGSDPEEEPGFNQSFGFDKPAYLCETPKHQVDLPAFYIDRYEVTVGEYAEFLEAANHSEPRGWDRLDLKLWKDYPVVRISWKDASAYAKWLGKRLPSEAEWEKAARGPKGQKYPWGNKFVKRVSNISQDGLLAVGTMKKDLSPYGVYDMGGNAAEWTSSKFAAYPGSRYQDPDYRKNYRVYRGGSWGGSGHYYLTYFSRGAFRGFARPETATREIGFRCAKSAQ